MNCAIIFIALIAFTAAQQSNPSLSAVLIPEPPFARCATCTSQASYFNGISFTMCNAAGFSTYTNCVRCCNSYGASQRQGSGAAGFLSQNGRCICCLRC
uniref:Secreted protein n=1 Tax=Ascaris lumbricoides TaxID=6252 RepID=A0A0M3HX97_ASCLU